MASVTNSGRSESVVSGRYIETKPAASPTTPNIINGNAFPNSVGIMVS